MKSYVLCSNTLINLQKWHKLISGKGLSTEGVLFGTGFVIGYFVNYLFDVLQCKTNFIEVNSLLKIF